jgi:hypothetical protein
MKLPIAAPKALVADMIGHKLIRKIRRPPRKGAKTGRLPKLKLS